MFKQLSQIGKNLTDELAKGLTEDLNEGQDQFDSNSDLPRDVQAKLKKFEKYEQKYPLLLGAYKNEKLKNEKIATLQKILSENTPISSADDFESLESFFKNLDMKTSMLNEEIKRLNSDRNESQKKIDELNSQLAETIEKMGKNDTTPDSADDSSGQSRIAELEKLLSVKEESYSQVKEELRNKNEEIETLRKRFSEIEALTNESKESKEQVKELQTSIMEEKGKNTQIMATIDTYKLQLAEKEVKLNELKEKLLVSQSQPNSANIDKETEPGMGTQTTQGKSKKKKRKAKNKTKIDSTKPIVVSGIDLNDNSEDPEEMPELPTKYKQLLSDFESLKAAQKDGDSDKVSHEEYLEVQKKLDTTIVECRNLQKEVEIMRKENERAETELQECKKSLKFTTEELDNVKDILKTVGNELVDAKDQIKNASSVPQSDVDNLKKQLEALRTKNSEEFARYEASVSELNKNIQSLTDEKTKLSKDLALAEGSLEKSEQAKMVLEQELHKVNENISKFRKENNSLSDQLREFNTLKRSESSMRMSVGQKEKTITYLEQQVKELSTKEEQAKNTLRVVKLENDGLVKRSAQLSKDNGDLKNELKKNEISLQNCIKENGKLSERLDVLREKYETLQNLKSNSNDQVDSIKRQCEELNVKLKEANKKILSLEDELNENTNVLQERTREATTMRRLLNENQNERGIKLKELEEKLRITTEEKSRLEGELGLQTSRKNREVQDLKELNSELNSEIRTLSLKEKQLYREIEHLNSVNENIQKARNNSTKNSDDVDEALADLKEALSKSEKKIRDLQKINEELRDLNSDLNKKLDRISRNYKSATNQLSAFKERNTSRGPSRSNSVASMTERVLPESGSRRASFIDEPSSQQQSETQSQVNDKIAYIKNVLLGFLEHRDQREQLLPVISMLLQLDSSDEKRLLVSLR